MIHFISRYFYEVDRNRVQMLTREEKRRFIRHICALALCIAIILYLWLK